MAIWLYKGVILSLLFFMPAQTIGLIKTNKAREENLAKIKAKMPVPSASVIYDLGLELLAYCADNMLEPHPIILKVIQAVNKV